MPLTHEQQDAVDMFCTASNMKVIAYAGAGKTTLLTAMAQSDLESSGIYFAFNKGIAQEAQRKFVGTRVSCRTAHSVAFRYAMHIGYNSDKLSKPVRMFGDGIPQIRMEDLRPKQASSLVRMTLGRFLQSDNDQVEVHHVPNLVKHGFIMPEIEGVSSRSTQGLKNIYLESAVRYASQIWERMRDINSHVPLGHDGYLKLWSMANPELPFETIYIDEAQDTNPCMMRVYQNQLCQIVSVGDPYQQIYSWRGAIDAMKRLNGYTKYLSQSFRFGNEIADEADLLIEALGRPGNVPLRGMDTQGQIHNYQGALPTIGETVDAILCRSNMGVIGAALKGLEAGRDIYVPGGTSELRRQIDDFQALKTGGEAKTDDLIGFKSWDALIENIDHPDLSHLRPAVKMFVDYGYEALIKLLEKIHQNFEPGMLSISTAHKAKGLEWDTVMIAPDFAISVTPEGEAKVQISEETVRLLYVAMTRARTVLHLPTDITYHYANAVIV